MKNLFRKFEILFRKEKVPDPPSGFTIYSGFPKMYPHILRLENVKPDVKITKK